MGRSQVKYNQAHGRPGQKGGRGSSHSKQQEAVVFKRNDRDQDDDNNNNIVQEAAIIEDIEMNVMVLESYGNYMSPTENQYTNDIATSHHHNYGLDLSSMRQLLVSTLTVAERLKVPHYLISNEDDNHDGDESMININHDYQDEKNNENDNEVEDDLDSWLDSVIA